MGCTFGKPEEVRPLGLQKRRLTQLVGESAAGTFTTVKTAPFVFVSEARLPAAAGDAAALEVRFAGKTVPGRDATHLVKQNQDQCFAITDFAEGVPLLLGVLDGHGTSGQRVSDLVKGAFPRYLLAARGDSGATPWEEAIKQAAERTNKDVKSMCGDVSASGTTMVVAMVFQSGEVLMINVGDSRAVAAELCGDARAFKRLTRDHKPEEASENARILGAGGKVHPLMYRGMEIGPNRVWLASDDAPGLCMTRSFGDTTAARVGVIAEPELSRYQVDLEANDAVMLCMCTDGVFEFLEDDQVTSRVAKAERGHDFTDVVDELLEESRELWIENEEDCIDDCTAVLAIFSRAKAGEKVAEAAAEINGAVANVH